MVLVAAGLFDVHSDTLYGHLHVTAGRSGLVARLASVLEQVFRSHCLRMIGYLVLLELVAVKEPFAAAYLLTLLGLVAALRFLGSFQNIWWRTVGQYFLSWRVQ